MAASQKTRPSDGGLVFFGTHKRIYPDGHKLRILVAASKKQNHLTVILLFGTHKRIRTSGLPLRRRLLYPAELCGHGTVFYFSPTGRKCQSDLEQNRGRNSSRGFNSIRPRQNSRPKTRIKFNHFAPGTCFGEQNTSRERGCAVFANCGSQPGVSPEVQSFSQEMPSVFPVKLVYPPQATMLAITPS